VLGDARRYLAGHLLLNLRDPQTPHVFAASKQIDLILDYAKRISFDDDGGRLFMVAVVAPCFAALRWLNETHFHGSHEISKRIDELNLAILTLAELGITKRESPFERKSCPVCNASLTTPNQYDPVPYCPDCLDCIMPALSNLQSCDGGFGTDAI
jgi:hypothetical protein